MAEGAILAGVRGAELTPEKANAIAKAWLQVQRRMQYDDRLQRLTWGERDFAKLEEVLRDTSSGGLRMDPAQAREVLEYLTGFVRESTDTSVRYKPRLPFAEGYRMTMVDPKTGAQTSVGFTEFLENDIRVIANTYSRQISGLIGSAKVGLKSTSDWEARIREVVEEADARGLDKDQTVQTINQLEMGRKWALGMPLNPDPLSTGARVLRFVRDFNFIRLMGQAGFAQLPEVGNLMGMAGMRAFSLHVPAFKNLVDAAKLKPLDTALSRQLDTLVGTAANAMGHSSVIRELGEFDPTVGLSVAERAAARGRDMVAHVSGLRAVNYELKKSAEVMFAQRMVDLSHGVEKLDDKMRLSLASDGLEEEGLERVMAQLQKHSTLEGPEKKLVGLDTDAWMRQDPDTLDAFRMALHRQVNRAIQETSIGEAPWFIHKPIAQVMFQFRGFVLGAWAKQTLYGLNHMDARVASAWGLSSLFAGMAYAAQTSFNFAQNQKELDKRLTLEKIAAASFSRAGWSSLVPMGIDTIGDMALNEPVFAHARTTGMAAGSVLGIPTVDLGLKVHGVLKSTMRSAFDEQHLWTQSEAKAALQLLFLSNTYAVRNLVDAASQEFPKRNYLEPSSFTPRN